MQKRAASVLVLFSAALLMMLCAGRSALACPDGQYNACAFGVCACVPNGDTVIHALNPLPDTLIILGGAVKGDIHAISQGVGGLVIQSACPGCAVAGQTVLSANDKAFVEEVVGRGWLVFFATGSPTLVIADAATSVTKAYALTHPGPNPLQPSPPAGRGVKHYRVQGALCAVKSDAVKEAAGWVTPPVLVDDAGASFIFPGVDLQHDDLLEIMSINKECPSPIPGQSQLTTFKMKFDYSQTSPDASPTAMKYFFIGDAI